MSIQYFALWAGIAIVVWLLVWFVFAARRRLGRFGMFLAVLLEAVGAGALVYYGTKYIPAMQNTWISEQLTLAIVGIVLAIFLGGGLLIGLGGGRRR